MAEKTAFAFRNLRMCSKECLCLYVCPTGATDTENSIIDTEKCIGCGKCAEACTSGAISMVPLSYPPQQTHTAEVTAMLKDLAQRKAHEEAIAQQLPGRLAKAFVRANRVIAEDIVRETGYMLPQSEQSLALIAEVGKETGSPAADRVLKLLQ